MDDRRSKEVYQGQFTDGRSLCCHVWKSNGLLVTFEAPRIWEDLSRLVFWRVAARGGEGAGKAGD